MTAGRSEFGAIVLFARASMLSQAERDLLSLVGLSREPDVLGRGTIQVQSRRWSGISWGGPFKQSGPLN